MAEINPMVHLINTILSDKELIIFVGSDASVEGKKGGKNFPSFDEIIDNILKDWGFAPTEGDIRIENFLAVIKKWEQENKLQTRLSEYLDGEPGLVHYYLAALSIALFGESNALLYLSTNYDDLIKKAFTDLERNRVRKFNTIIIPMRSNITGLEFQEIVSNIEYQMKKGQPVILKLFGDLNSQISMLKNEDVTFEPEVEKALIKWMKKPMLVIGYNFSDKTMKELLISSRGFSPVFLITSSEKVPFEVKRSNRVYHIKANFMDFTSDLLEMIEIKKPSINRKIDKILEFLDPTLLYPDFNSVRNRVNKCSNASLLRAEERIPKIEINGKLRRLIPIERKDTSPDFDGFIQSDRALLAVIGDSGLGKSTLLYRIAKDESNKKFITLFYDVHHLQSTKSLTERLSMDFRCESRQLETIFEHFNKILSNENKKLLIMVDGLNESVRIDPSDLKTEIEDLGTKLPRAIKIVYSCRTIYWESYIKVETPLLTPLYFGSKEFLLGKYSLKETKEAFEVYQSLYKFEGAFDLLKEEFKEKIRDPLMLRMLAEGYQGKKSPAFAPAVKIFRNYEDSLRKKFAGTVLIDFIEELILQKLKELEGNPNVSDQFDRRSIRANPTLTNITLQQINIDKRTPLVLLEDEGVLNALDKEKNVFRFTYDRFFEYLLGKEIVRQFKIHSREDFINKLEEKILAFQHLHFSFLQALKSEIIRQNIDALNRFWSFFDSETLKSLINNRDAAIVNFTKEVLRELTFESEENTIEALKGITHNDLSWKLLALDIAGDSPQIKPILIEGLFSGEKHFTRRCIQKLFILNEDITARKNFEEEIILAIKNNPKLKNEHIMGLIYYTGAIFLLEDSLGNDPFEQIQVFWKSILEFVQGDINKNLKEMLTNELIKVVNIEGPYFFAEEARAQSMGYLFEEMPKKVRALALKMLPYLIDNDKCIDQELREIIYFFGSELKHWEKRKDPESNSIFAYKFEFLIAQWILILYSKTQYDAVKVILESFVDSKHWTSVDFALCTMKYILQIIYPEDRKIIEDGFITMKRWTEKFEREDVKFFDALESEDPFKISYNPLEQASRIDILYFTPKEGPVSFLEERLTSFSDKKIRYALLCARYLWKDNPMKILGTLELVVNSKDPVIRDWVERILKEIYLVHPRIVEDFFWKNKLSPQRIQAIKYRTDVADSFGSFYESYPLFKSLFLQSRERRVAVVEWYKKLINAPDLFSFCYNFIENIIDKIRK